MALAQTSPPPSPSDAAGRASTLRRALEGMIGVPATEGNSVEVLRNGSEIFPAMLEGIASARRTVDLLTFVYWRGEIGARFAEALCDRARAGVRVRVLLDAWGAHPMEKTLVTEMEESGVLVRWFRPLARVQVHKANHRTRAQRRRVARHALPHSGPGGRRLARGLPRQLGRD